MARITFTPRREPPTRRFLTPEEMEAWREETRRKQGLTPGCFRATLRERWASIPHTPPTEGNPAMGYKIVNVKRENTGGALVAVPDEVATDLEATYLHLADHPKEAALVTFDTADEVKTFLSQARSWAATRPAGAVTFRKLPDKSLGDKSIRFYITTPKATDTPAETPPEAPAPEPVAAGKSK